MPHRIEQSVEFPQRDATVGRFGRGEERNDIVDGDIAAQQRGGFMASNAFSSRRSSNVSSAHDAKERAISNHDRFQSQAE